MKLLQKTLIASALAAASFAANAANSCGGHGHDSYYINSNPGGAVVSVSLGKKVQVLPDAVLTPGADIGQDFTLNADCTFTSAIYGIDQATSERFDLFVIGGTWAYPAESNSIFFTLSGDLSQGDNMDPNSAWFNLLNGGLSVDVFIPLVFPSAPKLRSFENIPQTVILSRGELTPNGMGGTVGEMRVSGKGISESRYAPSNPWSRKVQGFGLRSVITSATITPTDM